MADLPVFIDRLDIRPELKARLLALTPENYRQKARTVGFLTLQRIQPRIGRLGVRISSGAPFLFPEKGR
jgi:hypothetical protein